MEYLSAVSSVISIINDLIDVVNKIKSQDGSVDKLNFTIMEAREVLDLMFHHQLRSNDPSAFEKEAKILTKWCYDAEDLWDEKNLNGGNFLEKIAKSIIKSDETGELEKGFNEILTQYKRISTERTFQTTATHQCNENHGSHLSSSLIGRENDVDKVVQKLLSSDSTNGISILGMCGLGKSSLVQTIFNRDVIVEQFPCRSWVDVRDGIFVWNDAKEVIDASTRNKHYENLLIVFDNLLSATHTEWHKFWLYKKEQEKSKRVKFIITTHNPRIPERTVTASHYLEPLSVDCCEQVIRVNANLYDADLSGPHASQIVKSIAKRCEGLPLVAEMLGIVLAKCDDDQMDAIGEEGRLWQMPEFKSEILPKLSPSYEGIKSELRRCLAYLSLFPDNYHFNTDDLLHLFVGEFLLQPHEATSSLKKIGEKCVLELKERSILQSSKTSYKLHSFGQDFAMLAASGSCQHLHQRVSSLDNKVRHLSLSGECNSEMWSQISDSHPKLRTYLSLFTRYNPGHLGENPPRPKKSLSRLRVLVLTGTDVINLSTFIYDLKYLRYLDISYTKVARLPNKLHKKNIFLQFLKIKETEKLLNFPKNFRKLTNLKYIDWDESLISKKGMPCHIGELSCLESLPLFQIDTKCGYFINELKSMNNLQGSMRINNLQHVKDTKEAEEAMLKDKCDLKSIVLEWTTLCAADNCDRDKNILTGLRPHKNLKELKLINYGGENFPEWINNSMINKVSLMGCRSCYLPALGKMGKLKTLVLGYMDSVTLSCRSDGDTDRGVRFRSLESMKFHNMTELKEWAGLEAHGDLPLLKELTFDECPKIEDSLPFIRYLMESKPDTYISIDGECLRCISDGAYNSSAACPHKP